MEGREEGKQLRGLEGTAGRTSDRPDGAKGEQTVSIPSCVWLEKTSVIH